MKKPDQILTVKEAAKIRRSSAEAVRVLIRNKKLKATYFKGSYKIRKKDLDECLETTKTRRHD